MVSREEMEARLKKQHYALLGQHSASKTCMWSKRALKGEGVCYKEKFYGLKCHRCVQLSVTTNYCNNSCLYCWRDRDNWGVEKVDVPSEVLARAVEAQKGLLNGFGGNKKVEKRLLAEALDPKHFAISLTGETLFYPRLSEFIRELHKKGISSFVVTNGTLPKVMAELEPPTQLYLSLSAPNKDIYDKVCRPSQKDAWESVLESLDVLRRIGEKNRTVIRITSVKGINLVSPEEYAELIERAQPWFVEVKAYMWVGASRENLVKENMPLHSEIRDFAERVCENSSYRIVDEQEESRVVLLMNSDRNAKIDFSRIGKEEGAREREEREGEKGEGEKEEGEI